MSRLGVFVCHCGENIGATVDVEMGHDGGGHPVLAAVLATVLQFAAPHLAGMPDLDSYVAKGKTVWDGSKQTEWLWDQLVEKVVPKLSKLGGAAVARKPMPAPDDFPTSAPPVDHAVGALADDDFPQNW